MSIFTHVPLRSLAVAVGFTLLSAPHVGAQIPSLSFAGQLGGAATVRATTLDASGNHYLVGSFRGVVDFDPGTGVASQTADPTSLRGYIASYDATGNYRWAFAIGQGADAVNYCMAIAVDANDNVVITGTYSGTTDFDPGSGTASLGTSGEYVASYTSAGAYRWAFQPGYGRMNVGRSYWSPTAIAFDGSGNIVLAGSFVGSVDFDPGNGTATLSSVKYDAHNYSNDIVVAKYSSNGAYLWAFKAGSAGHDYANAVAVDASNAVNVTGSFERTVDFNPSKSTAALTASGASDGFVARYTSTGAYVSAFRLGGSSTTAERTERVIISGTGDRIVAGWFVGTVDFDPGTGVSTLTSVGTTANLFVARYSPTGMLLWAFSPVSRGGPANLSTDASGDIILSGAYTGTNDFDPDTGTLSFGGVGGYIARYSATAGLQWAFPLSGSAGGGTHAKLAPDGSIAVAGNFTGTVDFDPGDAITTLSSAVDGDTFIASYATSRLLRPLPMSDPAPLRHVAVPSLR